MGVVYHANYLNYFDLGRTEYLRACGCALGELEKRGIMLPVVAAEIRYKAPARYDETLVIRTQVQKANKVTITFHSQVLGKGGEILLAEGTTTLACVTREGRLQKIGGDVIAALTAV